MRKRILAIGMLLLLTAAATAAMQNGNDLYQQGLARETAGDIRGAVQIFERIVRDFSSNRTLTAKALVQLGRWSDLLGQDQARKHYERVIREFSDQKEPAAEAQARLDVLAKVSAPAVSVSRRLAVDWAGWTRRNNDGSLTDDGRHWLRYNRDQQAFELVEIGTNNVSRLITDGPNPAETRVGLVQLSRDRRRVAATVFHNKPGTAAQAWDFDRAELRIFEVGARGPGRVLATWDIKELSTNWVSVQPFDWAPRNDRVWLFVLRSDQSAQIASVDMAGKLEVLKTLTWRDHTQSPSLSPDGRFVAYHDATSRQTRPDLYILAADGSREQRIEHPADDSKPMFLPDGSGLAFVSDRRGVTDLWFQPVTDGRPSGQPRLVVRGPLPIGTVERFSDSGSLFYFFATSDYGTYTVPLNAATGSVGEFTRVAPKFNESNAGAAFSPDGKYLAHFRAGAARVVILDLITGAEREIPFGALLGRGSAGINWCTADTLIATGYVGGYAAYRVNIKDSSAERLPIAPIPYPAPVCVAGGEEIIYVPSGSAGGTSIVRRSLASGRESILLEGPVTSLALSPDGKRLAVVTVDPKANVARLITMSAAGGEVSADLRTSPALRVGTRFYSGLGNVVWVPTGDRLLVFHVQAGNFSADQLPTQWPIEIWEVPLTGAASRKLGLLPLPRVTGTFYGVGSFSMHPDGKLVAFQSHEGFLEQTWAIDNLAQFIKAGGGW
jgi:Tol biopolymer transport system component